MPNRIVKRSGPRPGSRKVVGRPVLLAIILVGAGAAGLALRDYSHDSALEAARRNRAQAQQVHAVAQPTADPQVAQTSPGKSAGRNRSAEPLPSRNPLNAARAYRYLQDICAIGRRPSGSPGMRAQQELVTKHFESLGGKVTRQEFTATDPRSGQPAPMANLIVTWHPDRSERLLLCAHYDTRPFPDRDPDPVKRREGVFIGANDGGSGVAVMMELAHLMPRLPSRYGVDFVLFDGEELVYREGDPYFLGSIHFAEQYRDHPPEHKYRWGVLMDMVGGANLQLFQERNSWSWSDTRPLVAQIWGLAQRLGVNEFIAMRKHEVLDDHIALRNTARIPTCDIIDFDYFAWHTTQDTPENCSGDSLAKVGWVLYEWMRRAE